MQPDELTYGAAISACEKCRIWLKALELLAEMRQARLGLNGDGLWATSAAMGACEKGERWEQALALFNELRSDGASADAYAYCAALATCNRGHKWELALDLLAEMHTVSIVINGFSYTAAITACEKGRQWQHCYRLLAEMQHFEFVPDERAYNAVILSCITLESLPNPAPDRRSCELHQDMDWYPNCNTWSRALCTLASAWTYGVDPAHSSWRLLEELPLTLPSTTFDQEAVLVSMRPPTRQWSWTQAPSGASSDPLVSACLWRRWQ
eukprot:gnl/TRDRNA2_/TRDRNA2_77906_c1_seq2.p1 gnl/TRDRNA2_/TRDRNA2_77906_c1~~gnl/TRDRNA2_/TRDRNA2_77906_c1_seq2.p1  ORF type:complete len:267 (+),score=37.83 gnl/TRDRNA2_/TRDRNA2_77906_c1_seq2:2-802(+)